MKAEKFWRAETQGARADHDFFPTAREATSAFIAAEAPYLAAMGIDSIDEPACGAGDMAAVIRAAGFRVHASDIADRGYGRTGRDFLAARRRRGRGMITNPPYKDNLPEAFLRHAAMLRYDYVAMLLKVQFWNPQGKAALWREFRPVREYKIGWRIDFLGLGGGMQDVCFWAWDLTRPAARTEVYVLTREGACL